MEYKNTLKVLKERNEELLAYYLEIDDEKNVKLHFVIKSILAGNKPFSKLGTDVSLNILKDLNFDEKEAFNLYKIMLLGKA